MPAFSNFLHFLTGCDETMDLIVLPEYSDAFADVEGKEGLRFGFLTCHDFYFYENFARFTNSQLRGISQETRWSCGHEHPCEDLGYQCTRCHDRVNCGADSWIRL